MENIATKVTGDPYTAPEFNTSNNELKNLITNTGVTLSGGDVTQIGKSIANIVGSVSFYLETGAADAYILNVTGAFQAPTDYRNGMWVRFRASNTNTGASTINVSSLGVQSIKKADGTTDPDAGDISTLNDTVIIYDGSNFRIMGNEINNFVVNNFMKTIFSGTPVTDVVQFINFINNVTDLANTGYGVGQKMGLSDANPDKAAGWAAFAETNNADSVGLAAFIFNTVSFLKVGQFRAPTDTEIETETYFESENFGVFIKNVPLGAAATTDFISTNKEAGIVAVMGIGGGDSRFQTSLFSYAGDGFAGDLALFSESTDAPPSLFSVAFLSTVSTVHTYRVTASGGTPPDDTLYIVKIPFRNGVQL